MPAYKRSQLHVLRDPTTLAGVQGRGRPDGRSTWGSYGHVSGRASAATRSLASGRGRPNTALSSADSGRALQRRRAHAGYGQAPRTIAATGCCPRARCSAAGIITRRTASLGCCITAPCLTGCSFCIDAIRQHASTPTTSSSARIGRTWPTCGRRAAAFSGNNTIVINSPTSRRARFCAAHRHARHLLSTSVFAWQRSRTSKTDGSGATYRSESCR